MAMSLRAGPAGGRAARTPMRRYTISNSAGFTNAPLCLAIVPEAASPVRYYWSDTSLPPAGSTGAGFCGFSSAEDLLANGAAAVWQATPITDTTNKYILRSRAGRGADAVSRCLIFGGDGGALNPELYYWSPGGGGGADTPADDDDGACGLGTLDNLLANKAAVWIIEEVPLPSPPPPSPAPPAPGRQVILPQTHATY